MREFETKTLMTAASVRAASAVRFVPTSPRLLVIGMRLLRAQIGDPESPMPLALPVRVVAVEIDADSVRATVSESGRGGAFTRRMVWNLKAQPDALALVCVDDESEG